MKYDFDFSHLPDYVVIKTGQFDVVENFYQLLKNLQASPKWIKGSPIIIDHQYLNLNKMTVSDVQMLRSICSFNSKKLGSRKCAFVIQSKSDTLCDQLSKLSEAEPATAAIRFFTTQDAAVAWILDSSQPPA